MSKQQRHGAPDGDDGGGGSRRGVLVAATQNPWRWWPTLVVAATVAGASTLKALIYRRHTHLWRGKHYLSHTLLSHPIKHQHNAYSCACGTGNGNSFNTSLKSRNVYTMFIHALVAMETLTHTRRSQRIKYQLRIFSDINYIFQTLIIHTSLKPETFSKTSPRYQPFGIRSS